MTFSKKVCFLFLIFIALAQCMLGQTTPFAFSHIALPNNLFARALMRDSKGYLWIGSDGLFRFDGVNTRRYIHNPKNNRSLINNSIKNIIEDKKGRIWIGAITGISCYDPATDSFTNYENKGDYPKHPQALLDNILYLDETNTLWCGDKEGLARFDEAKNRFVYYNLSKYQLPGHRRGNFITQIITDQKNKDYFWLASYDGFIHFNKKTGKAQYYYPPGPPLTMMDILQDSRGRIWLSTWGGGLGLFDQDNGRFRFFKFQKNLHLGSDNIVFNVKEDVISKDSSLFFISTNLGLAILNLKDPAKIKFTAFYTHQPNDAKSIGGSPSQTLIDKQGIIWVATSTDVSYILPATQVFSHVNSVGTPDALINYITEEQLPSGHYQYWLSCWYTGGLKLCDENFLPKKNAQLPPAYGATADCHQINQATIDPSTKNMWISTMDGLYKWNRTNNTIQSFYQKPGRLPSNQVMCTLLDNSKRLWIGTYHTGVCLMNTIDNSFEALPGQIQNQVKDKRVFCFYQDSKKRLWIGCTGTLLCLDEKTGNWQVYTHHTDDIRSKAGGDVNGICEDKRGNIWIGNSDGLNRFNEASNNFDLFTSADGLSNDHIYSIVCDKNGMLWIGTSNGLNSLNPVTNNIKSFYVKDGLLTSDVSNALILKNNNEVVMASANGYVTIFDPEKMYRNKTPPPIYITELKLFNKRDDRRSVFPMPKNIHLSYNENYFSIDFIALNLMNATDNKYAYQLSGLDKDWIQGGTEHSVTYSNLSPGKYIFKVKASNNDGVWNQKGSSLIIVISPPFWTTWWFIAICIVILLVMVYSIYNYRLEQLLRVERLRTRISTDLHDDIGSTLSSISILSELVLHKKDDEQANEMLNEIKDNAINLMERMDDIVWSINPKNDSLRDLLTRITRFAGHLFEAKNIEHEIIIPDSIKDLKLSMDTRQHLYLMIKESINNIIKHACCSHASISATYHEHLFAVYISDNGKGFDTKKASDGNGLFNLKERAEKMKGDINIYSSPGNGTSITIQLKIK